MTKHYHVLVGLQGLYLPNTNHYAATLREAEAIAAEEKRWWNDSEYDRPRKERDLMRGNIRKDRCYLSKNHIIEITECCEPECSWEGDRY